MKTPKIKDIEALLKSLKPQIRDDYRAFQDDEIPGMQVTVGADDDGRWNYQTGDNIYTGGAYAFPYWGVVGLYRRSNCRELAKDIVSQIAESMA